MEKLREVKFSLKDVFCFAVICFLAILLWQNFAILLDTTVWRHDALYYRATYYKKLSTEGRWINYIFFFMLKSLPPHIVIALSLACFCFFGYKIAKDFTQDNLFAVIFALALVQIHPIYSMIHWPVTPFLNYVLLAFTPFLKKALSKRAFFICTGILFFGLFFNFYDLMPLLFLSEVKDRKSFVEIMLLWILGFVVGYAVTQVITLLITGSFIQIAAWREPNPIKTFADLVQNIKTEYQWFCEGISGFFARRSVKIAFGCFAACLAYLVKKNPTHTGGRKTLCARLLFLFMVIISLYVQQVSLGVEVAIRTTFPLYCGLFAVALCCYNKKSLRYITIIVLSSVALVFWRDNTNDLSCFRDITNTWQTELKSICPAPTLHKGIKIYLHKGYNTEEVAASEQAICKVIGKNFKYTQNLGADYRWLPVALSIGFNINNAELCDKELPARFTKISPNGLYRYGYEDGYLYLTIDKKHLTQ